MNAKFGSEMIKNHAIQVTDQNCNFRKIKGRTAAILKIALSPYFSCELSDFDQTCHFHSGNGLLTKKNNKNFANSSRQGLRASNLYDLMHVTRLLSEFSAWTLSLFYCTRGFLLTSVWNVAASMRRSASTADGEAALSCINALVVNHGSSDIYDAHL